MKMRLLMWESTSGRRLFRGRRSEIGSHIFIRGGELEQVMGHFFYENAV